MSWYKKAQTGEWWIIDGQAIFADSDFGDIGHEAYVVDMVRREVADELGFYLYDEYIDWDEVKQNIIKEMVSRGELEEESLIAKYGADYIEKMPYNSDIFDRVAINNGIDKDRLDVADEAVDARVYGLKNLGWKRVAGNHVQTQTLTSKDLEQIDRGLYDAYAEQYDSDEDFNALVFDIEVLGNNKLYNNVPASVIESHDPKEVRIYGGAYSPYAYAKNRFRYNLAANKKEQPYSIYAIDFSGKKRQYDDVFARSSKEAITKAMNKWPKLLEYWQVGFQIRAVLNEERAKEIGDYQKYLEEKKEDQIQNAWWNK